MRGVDYYLIPKHAVRIVPEASNAQLGLQNISLHCCKKRKKVLIYNHLQLQLHSITQLQTTQDQ